MGIRAELARLQRRLRDRTSRQLPPRALAYAEAFPLHTGPVAGRIPPLRPYQSDVARAVLASIRAGDGRSFSVMMSRQAGKNELSAQLELAILIAAHNRPADIVKTAPTFAPQLRTSLRRLEARAQDLGLRVRRDGPNVRRIDRAGLVALSAAPGANVVGATAGLLLEVDEAQDVDAEKFDKDFRPMASTTSATTLYYGTAWTDDDLLAQVKAKHIEQEKRDGVRRHFEADWLEVTRYNPAYGNYVQAERARLGEGHPLFTTQYELRPLPGAGRMFTPAMRAALLGSHPRLTGPDATPALGYVAGLDVAGEDLATTGADRDWTVLSIARVIEPPPDQFDRTSHLALVQVLAWQGVDHQVLAAQLLHQLGAIWAVRRVVVDATGIGEGLASALAAGLRGSEVVRVRLSEVRKSDLGYGLITAASAGRLRLFAEDESAEYRALAHQLVHARAEYKPNRLMAWSVRESDGHDDHLMSLALAVDAARDVAPRQARSRRT